MGSIKRILIGLSVAAIVSIFVPAVQAQGMDEANWPMKATFDTAVQIGNLVLSPGTYDFRLVPGNWARTVVEVYSEESGRWVGMVMGINSSRVDTSKGSGFTYYYQTAVGGPRLVEYWYYPQWNRGLRFIYPRTQTAGASAVAMARAAR